MNLPIPPETAASLAKTGLENAAEQAGPFMRQVFGPAVGEVGEWLGERVSLYLLRNRLRIVKQAAEIARDEGFEPQAVPLRTLLPLLDYAGREDDPDLQELWAHLLARASREENSLPPGFPEVLRQLSPADADLLSGMFAPYGLLMPAFFMTPYPLTHWQDLFSEAGISVEVSMTNLDRLRIVRLVAPWNPHQVFRVELQGDLDDAWLSGSGERVRLAPDHPTGPPAERSYQPQLTRLGHELLARCLPAPSRPFSVPLGDDAPGPEIHRVVATLNRALFHRPESWPADLRSEVAAERTRLGALIASPRRGGG